MDKIYFIIASNKTEHKTKRKQILFNILQNILYTIFNRFSQRFYQQHRFLYIEVRFYDGEQFKVYTKIQ